MNAKPALYGKISDTGAIDIRVGVRFAKDGFVLNPDIVILDIEAWTARAIGAEQVRDFCMSVEIHGPITDSAYEQAYRTVLGTYTDEWKRLGADPDPEWKRTLAVRMGEAMERFHSGWKDMVLGVRA